MVERAENLRNPEMLARPSEYSPSMSKRILSGDLDGTATNHDVKPYVHEEVHVRFINGSLANREHFWKDKGAYGEQMRVWIKNTATWIDQHKNDPGMSVVFRALNIADVGPDSAEEIRTQPEIVRLVNEKINSTLDDAQKLNLHNLDKKELAVLDFYHKFLEIKSTPQQQLSSSVALVQDIAAIVGYSSPNHPRSTNEAYALLDNLAPFLRVTGLNAQHAFGAMIKAEVDAIVDPDLVKNAKVDEILPQDNEVLKFLKLQKKELEDMFVEPKTEQGEKEEIEVHEIVPNQDLVDKFSTVPTFLESDIDDPAKYNLTDEQKKVIRETLSKIHLSSPVKSTLHVDSDLIRKVVHGKPFFSNHPDIVPIVHAFASENPATGKQQDQNETINQGESIFPGHQDFFTGLAALMGSEIQNPQQRAETQASAALALADSILQVYARDEGAFTKLKDAQFSSQPDPRNFHTYLYHDIARHLGMEIKSEEDMSNLQEKIAALPKGIIKPVNGEDSTLFVVVNTNKDLTLHPQATFQKLGETFKKVYNEISQGQLTPQGAMFVEFLGNGLDVTKLAETIADRQKNQPESKVDPTRPYSPGPDDTPGAVAITTQDTVPAPTEVLEATHEINPDEPKPDDGSDKPDTPAGGVAIQNGQKMGATTQVTPPDNSPKPGDGGKPGEGKEGQNMESTAAIDNPSKPEVHGIERAKEFIQNHKRAIEITALIAAEIIKHEIKVHDRKIEGEVTAQEKHEELVAVMNPDKRDVATLEVPHEKESTYEAAKKESEAAEKMLKEYEHMRHAGMSRENKEKFEKQILEKVNEHEYKDEVDVLGATMLNKTFIHQNPGSHETFNEQVILFEKENAHTHEMEIVNFKDAPFVLNKDAYELRVPIDSGRQEDEAKGVWYAIPVFDSKGELIGAYKVLLSETPKKDEPVEVKAENESGESTTQETPAQTSSGSSWQSQRNRRGLEVSQ